MHDGFIDDDRPEYVHYQTNFVISFVIFEPPEVFPWSKK